MISKMFSIYDVKAEDNTTPWSALTVAEAIRNFMDLCTNPDTRIGQHAEDYQLFYIGDFDSAAGMFVPETLTRTLVANGAQRELEGVRNAG